jgi:GrpB-like predicted nucleotidyltransferase (UPF0157 family)
MRHSDSSGLPDAVVTRLESSPEQMAAAVVGSFPASRDAITISEPDRGWPDTYARIAEQLHRALGDVAVRIEHVGSTAVPGLAAKPIIDVDVTVHDSDDEAAYLPALESLGFWIVIREPWWHGHRMFVDDGGAVNLHVWPVGAAEPIRHLLFRDWLRDHPEDRDRYAEAKKKLSRDLESDPDRFNLAKNTVIDDIYARIVASFVEPPSSQPSGGGDGSR